MSVISWTSVRDRGRRQPTSKTQWLRRLLLYLVLTVGAIIFIFPFYWMVLSSLKTDSDVFVFPPRLLPTVIDWANYPNALGSFPFLQGLGNTLIIVAGVEVGRLLSVPLAAYAFAHFRFPLRGPLFIMVLATMMLPYQVTLIPQFLIFRDLGWLDTFLPLTVPSVLGGGTLGAFSIFLLRQFFRSIPKAYSEAAAIDGCGFLRIYWHIIVPLSKPALAVVAIFTFLQEWNDFFGPLIYLTSPTKYTLALNFQAWQTNVQAAVGVKPVPFNQIMVVATLITMVPIVVFFLTQRYFIRGVVLTGMKG